MAVVPGHGQTGWTWAQRARALDPLAVSGGGVAWILFQSHRYDEAIHELRSALAVHPDDLGALTSLGFVLAANDHPKDAIPVLEKVVSVSNHSPAATGVLIRAYALAGQRMDALRLLADLKKRKQAGYVPAAANAALGLGDYDQAFVGRLRHTRSSQTFCNLSSASLL
jgi:tetratricopeptide (TPR) repeat protein